MLSAHSRILFCAPRLWDTCTARMSGCLAYGRSRQKLTFRTFGRSANVDLAGARRRLHLRIRGFSTSLWFGRPCGPGWRSTPRTAVSQPATQPCDRGFVNVQALKRGDTLLLVLAAHPSRPAPNKKRGELRWPTKPLEGTPYSLTAEERAPRGPKSLLFTYKMYSNSFVFLSLLYSYNPLPSWMAPTKRGHPVILPLYTIAPTI